MNFLLKENYDSHNLWEKINLLSEPEIRTLSKGLEWTIENLSDAILIGGTATVHYVKNDRELTPDLDYLVNDISSVKDL